ncbi:N-acetylmuramoyl-L-alanine amidase family protein [Thermohalobacter berrensis]|uniref:MurNAc-LAA domain-containing protein n=1 Tax=Thermohalobacter berrensis TaxID=99594 RepID=A0A419SUV0_9FIRM|nr:N-acetylmuramoyl-L-alanine amidase family protein [Thermohalobacter berrensis]RKD28987.1 hypothetical protein BET03_06480 [Thermohalobacter berrensis]
MKRLVALSIILVMILGVVHISYAEYEPELVDVRVDGDTVKLKKINVLINGEPIDSDVPPVLYDNRTLVPIRFVANHLMADISWNQENREATIKTSDKEIILKIDSSTVKINGEEKELPYGVPAKLISDRTMVPLRFVSEALGFKVGWIPETWTGTIDYNEQEITNILVDLKGSMPKIIVETTGMVNYNSIYLEDPYRLVVDIPKTKLNIENENIIESNGVVEIDIDEYPIKEVRTSQFSTDPNTTRVVVELDKLVEHKIKYINDKKLEISFLNKVEDIELEKVDRKDAIVINTSKVPDYNVLRLSNPDRIVLDLMDSILATEKNKYDVETEYLKGIRTSQFMPDGLYSNKEKIVRIVLDIKEKEEKPNLIAEFDKDKIILFVDDKVLDEMDYDVEDLEANLEIDATRRTSYDVEYNEDKRIITVKLPDRRTRIEDGLLVINDDFINNIKVEEIDDDKVIKIKLQKNVKYEIESRDRDDEVEFSFVKEKIEEKEEDSKYSDKVIVIDPGHGGKDPGTHGYVTKVKEKYLNLKVALKLNEKLKELGFKTVLTRESDKFVDLYERADIANAADGDLFVSIHFNAHPKRDVSGIQTFYCPAYESELKTEDNFPFAEAIHLALLEELKREDRDIIRKPEFVVVRETKMPAVLVELGFLTNEEEEMLAVTDSYQDRAAQAIVNGIIKYLESKEK